MSRTSTGRRTVTSAEVPARIAVVKQRDVPLEAHERRGRKEVLVDDVLCGGA